MLVLIVADGDGVGVGDMTGGTWSRHCKAGQVPGDGIEGLVAETKVGLC